MGKFKVKPTRAVAKPFKNPLTKTFSSQLREAAAAASATAISAAAANPHFSDSEEDDDDDTPKISPAPKMTKNPLGGILLTENTGKISKRYSQQKRKKKSVTFSKNLTEVAKNSPGGGKEAEKRARVIQDILNKSAVSFVSSKAVKGQGGGATGGGSSAAGVVSAVVDGVKNLKKIIKKEIKVKKSRIRARREVFKKKLELVKSSQDEQKAAKKREKTVIVGDLKPMSKILDELQEETKMIFKEEPISSKSKPVKKLNKFSVKKRQKEMLDGLDYFKKAGL